MAAPCPCAAAPLCAQTKAARSLFTARILDARAERPIAQASILVPGLEHTARSSAARTPRLAQLAAGKHIARARTVGWQPMLIPIDVAQADTAEGDPMLAPTAQRFETMKAEAKAAERSGSAAGRAADRPLQKVVRPHSREPG